MNYGIIRNLLGKILITVACLMVFPLLCALIYRERFLNVASFLIPMGLLLLTGSLLSFKKAKDSYMTAREGFVIVALSWLLMSLFGALPFIISGEIPNFFTAFFEITSGFTTTGASALTADELHSLSHSMLFWRSFSHWIGGMGILVFILALIPESKEGSSVHILRAESPGPQVGRLVSKMQVTSRILYLIYIGLTVLEIIILTCLPDAKMTFFDSLICSFGTAGTGGFATTSASIGYYAASSQYVIAVFMLIFGINFSIFYFILIGNFKQAFFDEELRWYLCTFVISVIIICINICNKYPTFEEAFRHSFFQVASIMSTTGFSTVDYGSALSGWPGLSLTLICVLSIFGACAGSTAGGMKTSRFVMIMKATGNRIKNMISPRRVEPIRMNGKAVEKNVIDSVITYFLAYAIVLTVCALLISIYNPKMSVDPLTAFTASLACISNVGPGLGAVGPGGGYADFSAFSKIVLSFEMIAGRLELIPILILFNPRTWKKRI